MRYAHSTRLASTLCLILALLVITAGCVPATQAPPPATAEPTKAPAVTAAPPPTEAPAPTAAPAANPLQPTAVAVSVNVAPPEPPVPCPTLLPVETITAAFKAEAAKCYIPQQMLTVELKSFFKQDSRPAALKDATLLQVLDLGPVLDILRKRDINLQVPHFEGKLSNDDLVLALYALPSSPTVSDVISKFDTEANGKAFADPNYLIGEPFIEGHPHGVVGSPFGDAAAAPDAFADQWAFKQINLTSPASSGTFEAGGIPLGIFDTFSVSMTPESVSGYAVTVRHDQANEASLTLCVKSPTMHAEITPVVDAKPIPDHGVFAAYLAQAVAPNSKISLYQVLNEYGDGDLATLNRSLLDFILTTENSDRGVVNLSLGLKSYEDPNSTGPGIKWPSTGCGEWIPDLGTNEGFEDILYLARQLGFVVVAAAGNSANNAASTPAVVSPDIPARLGGVIGVAASNSDDGGELACFSNWGDGIILAPGGEGRGVGQHQCDPPPDDCDQQPDLCQNERLISLMPSSNTGYGYWTGTSFAAPLVSGLAVRCLEANGGIWRGMAIAEGVSGAISTAAVATSSLTIDGNVLTLKRVDLPATLERCK